MKTTLLFLLFVLVVFFAPAQTVLTADMLPQSTILTNWSQLDLFGINEIYGDVIPDQFALENTDFSNSPWGEGGYTPKFDFEVSGNQIVHKRGYDDANCRVDTFMFDSNGLIQSSRTFVNGGQIDNYHSYSPPVQIFTFPMYVGDNVESVYVEDGVEDAIVCTYVGNVDTFVTSSNSYEDLIVIREEHTGQSYSDLYSYIYYYYEPGNLLTPVLYLVMYETEFGATFYLTENLYELQVSVDEREVDTSIFSVFPNPCQDEVTVDLGDELFGAITILNLWGGIVYEENVRNGSSIDVTDYESGIYLVRWGDTVKRLVKK